MQTAKSLASSLSLHTLCLGADGRVYCFGFNSAGQAGVRQSGFFECFVVVRPLPPSSEQAADKDVVLRPEPVAVCGEAVVETATGFEHSLARTETGAVYAWGANDCGQLGLGHTRRTDKPTLVQVGEGKKVVGVACGTRFSVAVDSKGQVYIWGSGCEGVESSTKPVRVSLGVREGDRVERVACGNSHCLALTRQGRVLVWGRNANGQLGTEDSEIALFDGTVNRAVAVACGAEHSFVMTELGRVWGFGSNRFGQLGVGEDREPVRRPVEITHFCDVEQALVSGVACGAHHTVVLCDDGRVFAMGWNAYGQLGIAANGAAAKVAATEDAAERWLAIGVERKKREVRLVPEQIDGFGKERIVAVGCGREHSFAVAESGAVFGWGYNGLGQLGIDSQRDESLPVQWPLDAPKMARVGSVPLHVDQRAVLRRQALYLQQQTRLIEKLRLSTSSSSLPETAGKLLRTSGRNKHRKGSVSTHKPHCPSCDKPLKKGIHFCVHCGHKVDESGLQSSSAPGSPVVVPQTTLAAAMPAIEEEDDDGCESEDDPTRRATMSASAPPALADSVIPVSPNKAKPAALNLHNSPTRSSNAALPKMSSLQKVMFDMPSPMPMQRPLETGEDRRSSLDAVERAKVVSQRLSGRETAGTPVPATKLCGKCALPLHAEDKARGPDGNSYHIKCLRQEK